LGDTGFDRKSLLKTSTPIFQGGDVGLIPPHPFLDPRKSLIQEAHRCDSDEFRIT
jgi:hypothetical protein